MNRGVMVGWLEQGKSDRQLRLQKNDHDYEWPIGSIERAEIVLADHFLYKPFESYFIWARDMKRYGFVLFPNWDTLKRDAENVKWLIEIQVYLAERNPFTKELEQIFVRTVRLESMAELTRGEMESGNR